MDVWMAVEDGRRLGRPDPNSLFCIDYCAWLTYRLGGSLGEGQVVCTASELTL